MVIYILKIDVNHYDQEQQFYDEDKKEEYWLWALDSKTAINKMRKWRPPVIKGARVDITRDTIFRQMDTRTVDYFIEYEDGSTDLVVVDLKVEPCVSIDDSQIQKIFNFA